MATITLQPSEYNTLVSLARQGATTADSARSLESFLQSIERANGVERDTVLVQWQELGAPLPAGTSFPESWPPQLRSSLTLVSRRIAKTDVQALVAAKASQPTSILVTRDPAGLVGWTELDAFFR